MWRRTGRAGDKPVMPGLGIGVQVHVIQIDDADDLGWPGEPTGLIVSTGPSTLSPGGGTGVAGPAWVVEFDEPQYRKDGRGPFARAQILQSRLVAAVPMEDL
jgi:hypothetical protein